MLIHPRLPALHHILRKGIGGHGNNRYLLRILPPGQSGVDGARLTVQAEDGHGSVRTEAFDTVDGAVQWAATLLRDGR